MSMIKKAELIIGWVRDVVDEGVDEERRELSKRLLAKWHSQTKESYAGKKIPLCQYNLMAVVFNVIQGNGPSDTETWYPKGLFHDVKSDNTLRFKGQKKNRKWMEKEYPGNARQACVFIPCAERLLASAATYCLGPKYAKDKNFINKRMVMKMAMKMYDMEVSKPGSITTNPNRTDKSQYGASFESKFELEHWAVWEVETFYKCKKMEKST